MPTPKYKKRSWWDDTLSYSTVKIVKIKDWRLGALHYLCLFAIVIYVALYSVWWNQGYLAKEVPLGLTRATLRAPATNALPSIASLPYCTKSDGISTIYKGYPTYPCQYQAANNIAFPVGATSPVFLSTRYKIFQRNPATIDCTNSNSTECIITDTSNNLNIAPIPRFYTAGIENYTLFIDHIVYALSNDFAEKSQNMKGEVLRGKDFVRYLDEGRAGDIFSVGEIMNLANVDLDTYSGVPGGNNTYRYDGIQLLAIISYSNRVADSRSFKYTIKFIAIPGIDTTRFDMETATEQHNRHGIVISFIQTGIIGRFSFPALLTSIVGGAVLTGVATTIVDLLAVYILPQKKTYGGAKFQETETMSAIEKKPRPVDHQNSSTKIDIEVEEGKTSP